VLPKAVYEELWASYQVRVAESERTLRDFHNQYRAGQLNSDRSGLDAIRRRLFLAEKGAVSDALRKRIVSEDLVQPYIKDLDEKLLSLEDD
jgi:CPA1 family monovalent cation:H+ antiporter